MTIKWYRAAKADPNEGQEVMVFTIGVDGALNYPHGAMFKDGQYLVTCYLFDPPEIMPIQTYNRKVYLWAEYPYPDEEYLD